MWKVARNFFFSITNNCKQWSYRCLHSYLCTYEYIHYDTDSAYDALHVIFNFFPTSLCTYRIFFLLLLQFLILRVGRTIVLDIAGGKVPQWWLKSWKKLLLPTRMYFSFSQQQYIKPNEVQFILNVSQKFVPDLYSIPWTACENTMRRIKHFSLSKIGNIL